jgi:DNA-binding transcriptional MerR regulator
VSTVTEQTDDETLTARAAAERLGVSVRTLDRYVEQGLIAPRRPTPTARRRFVAREVDALRNRTA